MVRDHKVDAVLQPVPISPKTPSAVHGAGVPVVIGPMRCGLEPPPRFRHLKRRLTTVATPLAGALTPLLQWWGLGSCRRR